jgi:hypothetical protein
MNTLSHDIYPKAKWINAKRRESLNPVLTSVGTGFGENGHQGRFSTYQGKHYQIGTIWYRSGRSPAKRGMSDMPDRAVLPITMVRKFAKFFRNHSYDGKYFWQIYKLGRNFFRPDFT